MPKKDTGNEDRFMIPLELANSFLWSKSRGLKIENKRLEKKLSRAEVSKRIKEKHHINDCGNSYVRNVEKGIAKSVRTDILLALIDLLDMDIQDFLI
jgi:transcriptional regulator with XRE-family HTH domain